MTPTRIAIPSLFLALALCACSSERWEEWASQADESADAVSSEGALYVAMSDGAQGATTAEEAASAAAASSGTFFSPSGCVTATAAGAVVTYVLDRCVGPFGYVTYTGTVVVTYSAATASSVEFSATSTGMRANLSVIDFSSSGTVSRAAATRTAVVTSTASGTGRLGTRFSRSGSYTLSWTDTTECLGLDGSWSTTIGGVAWSTNVSGYDRCARECPASGGVITWSSASGALTVRYDGGATASWSVDARRDRTGTVALRCGGV